MIKKRYLVALSAFSAAIAACGSDTTGNNGGSGATPGTAATSGVGAGGGTGGGTPTGGTGGGNPTGGTGGGNPTGGTGGGNPTGGTGGGGTGGDGGTGAVKCVSGVPSTSQVPRILNRQYDAAVRDLLGVTTVGTDIPSANLVEDSEGPMTSYMWKAYLDVGSKIANAVMTGANKAKFMNCDAAAAGCLETSIRDFGRKAFRRPMTDAEVTNFVQKLNAAMPAGTPDQVAETALWTFLVSPSFLLIPEMNADSMEAGAIKLSQYEVAARLSFLLWGSVPDQALSDAADQGMLGTKEQILTQANRMIAVREKTGPMISAFHRVAWAKDNNTSTSHWWKMSHDANAKYVATAKADYRAELDKFFEEVAFSNGGFKDLFLSPVAFVNKNNAAIYGLDPNMYGTDLTKVTLDAEQRPGFMTRVGFLSSFAHGTETAPILRGAFVTVNMIGVDPGPPMIDPSQIPQLMGTFMTNREYVETLTTSQASCSGCHTPYVNPPGFTLENYDEVGAWQTVDPKGGPIDAVADVTFSDTVTKTISTPRQLMEEIGNTPFAKHMYAEQWVQFATGRYPNDNDACTVDSIDMKLSTDGYSVLSLLADITQSDSFRLRVKATP